MTRTRRHLNILALADPLHRQASQLQSDVNASFLLVHNTMSKAFAEPEQAHAPAQDLAQALHADLLHNFHAAAPKAPTS